MRDDTDRIRDALEYIQVGRHDERVRVAFMLKSALGEAGRPLWDEWREGRGDDDADSDWRSAKPDGPLKIGSLFHAAKVNGWRDDGQYRRPTEREIAERKRIEVERAAKADADIARECADTAKKAAAIWNAATEAKADHPYLLRKRVAPVATVREIDVGVAAQILGYQPKSCGEQLAGRLLVVPVKQGDQISTLELIDGDKRKAALIGRGTKAGGYWATQPLPDGDGAGRTVLIGEGVATVLSASTATGHPSIAALSSGNLRAVAKVIRERYPSATLVILADLVKATGQPDRHAIEAARSVDGKLAIPDFGTHRDPDMKDMNDLFIHAGPEAVKRAVASAGTPEGAGGPVAARSAPEGAYPRGDSKSGDDHGMAFPEIEPWPTPVEPASLLNLISETVRRFIVCARETADSTALWAALTWVADDVSIAPLAVITAPEKRCGKSLLLGVLSRVVRRPLAVSNVTPAALFRSVDAWGPTLLVDEADAFMRDNEELRGILNAGHTRDSAYVIRLVGEKHEPRRFNIWGFKALAGIGRLPDTIMDRAIVLELRRKLPHEKVDRLRHAEPGLFDEITSKLARFADDYSNQVGLARPELPAELNDRAQDNWEPLLAIADVAGGEWPDVARRAALRLSGGEAQALNAGSEMLADIRAIFDAKTVDRISSDELINALCADTEAPWATYNRGKPMTPRQLAKLLRDYGISSQTVRIGVDTRKGFQRAWFEESFSRYLSPPESVTTSQGPSGAGLDVTDQSLVTVTESRSVTLKTASSLRCDVVTDYEWERDTRTIEVVL